MQHLTRWGFFVWLVMLAAIACTPEEDPFIKTPEELADRIRANTPTELPPVTTKGLNTMGAWIHPQPSSELHRIEGDSFLFVASGVERPTAFNTVSTSCDAFENFYFQSSNNHSVNGIYCERPEIDDDRRVSLILGSFQDSSTVFLNYRNYEEGVSAGYIWISQLLINTSIIIDDRSSTILSGTFEGSLINREGPSDTIVIHDGRFDVTYSISP